MVVVVVPSRTSSTKPHTNQLARRPPSGTAHASSRTSLAVVLLVRPVHWAGNVHYRSAGPVAACQSCLRRARHRWRTHCSPCQRGNRWLMATSPQRRLPHRPRRLAPFCETSRIGPRGATRSNTTRPGRKSTFPSVEKTLPISRLPKPLNARQGQSGLKPCGDKDAEATGA